MKKILTVAVALVAASSFADIITFDEGNVSVGNTLSNQYAGVTFAPGDGGYSGITYGTGNAATNTNMTIVSSTGGDVGGLGSPSLVSGNLLRSFNGWLGENNDPVFTITFANAITDFSLDMAGIANASSSKIYAFDASGTLLSSVAAGGIGQQTLALTSLTNAVAVVVTPGDFNDWVGVDNIRYTPATVVPEPATMAAMGLGIAAMLKRRRK